MNTENLINRFFLSNPFYRGISEIVILIGTGIFGLIYSWSKISIFPITNITGVLFIVFAFAFHTWAEKDHKQAHERSGKIEKIVETGVYSTIRHPLYLTIILQNIGIALAFGVMITLILSLITVFHWIITCFKEEAVLLSNFPKDYAEYKQRVKWRMIPGIF
ncbi:isoprenylcysteine carboxylmethyltransferase family protein [Candidatus Peregrinibacteria bacterium]|nr:isoprenylcysteine carboxylmethyltransferase family protein [Candidatus Peregrinibacteria bacterium]